MKKNIILILLIIITNFIFAANNKDLLISVPKTLSSIPLIELDGKNIGGYVVKVNYFDDHILTMGEFINGKIDIFMTGYSQGVGAFQTNKSIAMVSNPVWGVSVLLTNNPDIKTLADFTGKSIMVPFAKSPLDLQLKAILKKENLLDKVTIDYAPIQQQIPLLVTGKTAGISIPEPMASKLIIEKKAIAVFTYAKEWGKLNNGDERSPQVSLFIKKDNKKLTKTIITKLNNEISQVIIKIKKDNTLYLKKYADLFGLTDDIISAGLKNTIFDMPDTKTLTKLCTEYEKSIESGLVITDDFFYK